MVEIQGKYNKAKVFSTTVENECISQITPFTSPAMSTISTVVGTIRPG